MSRSASDAPVEPGWLSRHAWLPIPLLLLLISGLWVADLRAVYESRVLMVALNLVFTWLASLSICLLTARAFLSSGQPGLLMFSCGSLLWGITSVAAAGMIDVYPNPTITVHNTGMLGAAACHLTGLYWRGRLARPGRLLLAGYATVVAVAAVLIWAPSEALTPIFFEQGRGGTPIRHAALVGTIAMFAWVAWQLLATARWRPGSIYYWYGLGLGLVATGLVGVALLSVQGGILGWTNRLTQYLGSAYLLVAAWLAAGGAGGGWTFSLEEVHEALRAYRRPAISPAQSLLRGAVRYGLALAAVAAALGLRTELQAWAGGALPPYLTFAPAIMVVSLLAGVGPGLAATLLSGAAAWAWILPQTGAPGDAPVVRVGLVLFVASGLLMSAVAGLYRHYRDQSAAHEQEAALHDSRARLAALAEATFEGIAETEDGRITDCNEQLGQLLGYPVAELRGMRIAELVAPEDRARVLENAMARRDSAIEHAVVRKDGSRLVVEAHGRQVPGSPRRHTALRDVTERRRAEDALREADRRKDEFLGVLSHELRNPLAPIRNGLYVLQQAPPAGGPARRALDVIDRQVTHLTRLVDDLLDLTRISHGKIHLQRERLDLTELVRRTVEDHRSLLAELQVRLALPDGPLWVDGDRTRLVQALGNLLSNAGKFTPGGGHLEVSLARTGDRAELRLADDGIGFDAETGARLFEPFAQADRSLARSRGGLGLGLALVRRLARLHGGEVTAASEGPDRGATFTLTLPCAAATLADGPGTPPEAPPLVPCSVLVVEDSVDSAESLAGVLGLWGHRVTVAHDGRAGLALARQLRPGVILCDIGLPGELDGYAVARALRQEPALAATTLVALTGYARPEDLRRSAAAGFDVHLAKPLDLAALRRLLAELAPRRVPAVPAEPSPA